MSRNRTTPHLTLIFLCFSFSRENDCHTFLICHSDNKQVLIFQSNSGNTLYTPTRCQALSLSQLYCLDWFYINRLPWPFRRSGGRMGEKGPVSQARAGLGSQTRLTSLRLQRRVGSRTSGWETWFVPRMWWKTVEVGINGITLNQYFDILIKSNILDISRIICICVIYFEPLFLSKLYNYF